jgi:hypothetical protein
MMMMSWSTTVVELRRRFVGRSADAAGLMKAFRFQYEHAFGICYYPSEVKYSFDVLS